MSRRSSRLVLAALLGLVLVPSSAHAETTDQAAAHRPARVSILFPRPNALLTEGQELTVIGRGCPADTAVRIGFGLGEPTTEPIRNGTSTRRGAFAVAARIPDLDVDPATPFTLHATCGDRETSIPVRVQDPAGAGAGSARAADGPGAPADAVWERVRSMLAAAVAAPAAWASGR